MRCFRHDVRRHRRRLGPLLVRPGEPSGPVTLNCDAAQLAAAAAAAARCRVPVDVALWTCADAVLAGCGQDASDHCRDVSAKLGAAVPAPTAEAPTAVWLRQLRIGEVCFDDELPVIWCPDRTSMKAGEDTWAEAVLLAADTARLRVVLDAECASAVHGLPLPAALLALVS